MSKIHYTITPLCGCHKRWASSQIASTSDPKRVTCKNCLRLMRASIVLPPRTIEADLPSGGHLKLSIGTVTIYGALSKGHGRRG